MRRTKWTPGPWMLATSNSWRRFVDYEGRSVCEPIVQRDGHPDLHFGSKHNAHLIAAAPEMYKALENLIEEAEGLADMNQGTQSEPLARAWERARAVLAKARGEEIDHE